MYPRSLVKWFVLFPQVAEAAQEASASDEMLPEAEVEAVKFGPQKDGAQAKQLGAQVNQRHIVRPVLARIDHGLRQDPKAGSFIAALVTGERYQTIGLLWETGRHEGGRTITSAIAEPSHQKSLHFGHDCSVRGEK